MKRRFFSLVMLVVFGGLSVAIHSCKGFNELGPESVFFKYNGQGVIPGCSRSHVYFNYNWQTQWAHLAVHSCDTLGVDFELRNYRGPGLYVLRPGDTNMRVTGFSRKDLYYDPLTQRYRYKIDRFFGHQAGYTYLRVLEHDTVTHLFHAVFEAHLSNESGYKANFTEGRIFVNVPYDY